MDDDTFTYEPRDKSGPMDIDSSYDTSRLDAYSYIALDQDGPARKRLHSELGTAVPYHASPSPGFAHFNTSPQNAAPLLLAALNTPRKTPTYDPSQWYSSGPRTPAAASLATQDVEMDSPARGMGTPKVEGRDAVTKSASVADEEKENEPVEEKEEPPRKFAKGAVTRTHKKREKAKREQQAKQQGDAVALRHSESTSPAYSKSEHHYNVHMTPPALRHSEIPALLLGYLQFIVNASIVLFCLYLAVLLVMTVQRDVKDKMREYSVEILQEIAECTNLYLTNRCDPALRVPAMEAPCKAWEACMSRDPTTMGRINIVAETFAGVINSFVEPISWKTMSFTLVTLSFMIILTNSALFNLRAKAAPHEPSPHPSGNFWPPYNQFMPQLPPQMPHPQNHVLSHQPPGPGDAALDSTRQIGWDRPEAKKKGWW
ncbi:hypothetical protein IAU60_005120 [Kwoniella sp. DSM 27419]